MSAWPIFFLCLQYFPATVFHWIWHQPNSVCYQVTAWCSAKHRLTHARSAFRSDVIKFPWPKPQVLIGIHASPRVSIILFGIRIIHEGEPCLCLSSSLSSPPSSQASIFSYHLLLGNRQEICPIVFFKGRDQTSCPEQEKDKPIGISLFLCISTRLWHLSSVCLCYCLCRGFFSSLETFRRLQLLLRHRALTGTSGTW